ncbi:MAG: NAD(P)/FAD-dependent oxidoreductase [Desulfobulbaceae bacterium]|nr:MAG: NAD(P)/FAD-dependent oxidoreductase [Desulfobulbaceae bacterium]
MAEYDVAIIGSGTAGQTAAGELVAEGLRVALVESSETPGGVCALRGCQAKKWFYEAMEIVARSRHLLGKGVVSEPVVDWHQVLQEKNRFTEKIPTGTVNNLRGMGVEYIEGEARFNNDMTIAAGGTSVSARYYVVASGAKPVRLPIEGNEHIITSDDFLELNRLPERIVFVGGGFVSFEFAHFAARLGSKPGAVHILEAGPRPLVPFDEDMVAQLVEASEDDGIRVQRKVTVAAVAKEGSGYRVTLASGESIETDLVVNGAGRIPDIDSLELESVGVNYNRAGIEVDTTMKSSNERIFAVGDCASTIKLARVADYEAKVAVAAILAAENGEDVNGIDYQPVPSVLFSYPQLGMVGKTEAQLQDEGIKYWKSADTKLSWPTYRRIGMKHGAYKILVGSDDCILGAHFLGDNTSGLVNTCKQAMIDRIPIGKLRDDNIMSPYPSRESDILYMLSSLLE